MPTKNRREQELIDLFLDGYEGGVWATATRDWLDERLDSSVEVVATRADGDSVAIEHTLVEIFVGDREDFERFRGFLRVRDDLSLHIPERMIEISIPKHTLVPGFPWEPVITEFHEWLRESIMSFPEGYSAQTCPVSENRISDGQLRLNVRVLMAPRQIGTVFINRYGDVDTGAAVEKALDAKLPKLAATAATRRILMFERNQFKQDENAMFAEVERRRADCPLLDKVNELWIAETLGYDTAAPVEKRTVDFRRYINGEVTNRLWFYDGRYSQD